MPSFDICGFLIGLLTFCRPQPEPCTPENIREKICDNFDAMKEAGDVQDCTFGMEDVRAILANPSDYSSNVVNLARTLNKNSHLIDLADWISTRISDQSHDRTNEHIQYEDMKTVLADKTQITTAVNYLIGHFDDIADNGGNPTALERSDIEAEITRLQDGTSSEKAIAETLTKIYSHQANGNAPGDLITILANASGNNCPDCPVLTLDGLKDFKSVLNAPCVPC